MFESEQDLSDDEIWRGQSEFPDLQIKSRDIILKRVDTIVPGHGPMFRVSRLAETVKYILYIY